LSLLPAVAAPVYAAATCSTLWDSSPALVVEVDPLGNGKAFSDLRTVRIWGARHHSALCSLFDNKKENKKSEIPRSDIDHYKR
jgi:hypothetical protein